MKSYNLLLILSLCVCINTMMAQRIVGCDAAPQDLRETVKYKIGQQEKADAITLATCLVNKEPGLDSNHILLSLAWLCDSIRERNSPQDTVNAINGFENSLVLKANYNVYNALGNLFYYQGKAPFDSALFYYHKSTFISADQETGYRELARIYESIGDSSYKTCSNLVSQMDSIEFKEEADRRKNLFTDADIKHQQLLAVQTNFNFHLSTLTKYYKLSETALDTCIINADKRKHDDITFRKIKVALVLKSNEFTSNKDYTAAVGDLITLTRQNDSVLKANAYYFLGSIAEQNKLLDTSVVNYKMAATIDKDKTLYWEALLKAISDNCRKNNHCDTETEEFALLNLIRLEPNQSAYYFRLGYLYDSLGFNNQKTVLYRKAAAQFENSPQDYFSNWLRNYTNFQPEITQIESYLSGYQINRKKYEPFPPEYFQALHVLAVDYYRTDNFIKAGYITERLLAFYPKDDSLKILLSSVYIQKNQLKNSLKMARKAKRQDKDFIDYKVMAFNLENKNAHTRSRWRYRKAIKKINALIDQQETASVKTSFGPDIQTLKEQRSKIYLQIAENLYKRKKYKRGKKFADWAIK